MKITLGINVNYSGYENLGFVKSLDPFVMNAQCSEILAIGIVDYIEAEKLEVFLQHLISKLRHGGKLLVSGRDIFYFATIVVTQPGDLSIVDINKLIYGNVGDRPYLSQTHVNYISDILIKYGLKIERKSLENGEYVVEAVRP